MGYCKTLVVPAAESLILTDFTQNDSEIRSFDGQTSKIISFFEIYAKFRPMLLPEECCTTLTVLAAESLILTGFMQNDSEIRCFDGQTSKSISFFEVFAKFRPIIIPVVLFTTFSVFGG